MRIARVRTAVAVAATAAIMLTGAMNARGDTAGAPIAVGTNPQQAQLTPDSSKLYVSNEGNTALCPIAPGTESVISTATNAVIGTIPVGVDPGPIRFSPDGNTAYVVNQSPCDPSGSVSVINVPTGTVTATVAVGKKPVTLSVSEDGAKVYVANKGATSNSVSVICTGQVPAVCSAANTITTTILLDNTIGIQPHVMAKSPNGAELWVAEQDCPAVVGCTTGNVAVICTGFMVTSLCNATNTDTVVTNVTVGPTPGSIHFTRDGSRAYVATRGNGALSIPPTVVDINAATHAVTNTIPITPPGFPTNAAPHSMRITPDGSKVYVVNKHSNDMAVICTGKVPAVCPSTDTVLTYVGVGDSPVRVELTDNGGRAYVVNEAPTLSNGTLSVICTGIVSCGGPAADTVMSTLTLGQKPIDLEINCATNTAYASNSGSNNVSVVNLIGAGTCAGSALDSDGDGVPDTVDNCPNWPNPTQALPPWTVPPSDPDCDGFSTAAETFMGTMPTKQCAVTATANDEPLPDAWPMDNGDDRKAGLADILRYIPVFNTTGPGLPYKARFDLNADNKIGLADILRFIPFFNKTCTP